MPVSLCNEPFRGGNEVKHHKRKQEVKISTVLMRSQIGTNLSAFTTQRNVNIDIFNFQPDFLKLQLSLSVELVADKRAAL